MCRPALLGNLCAEPRTEASEARRSQALDPLVPCARVGGAQRGRRRVGLRGFRRWLAIGFRPLTLVFVTATSRGA